MANLGHIAKRDLDSKVLEDALRNEPLRLNVEVRHSETRIAYLAEATNGEIFVVDVAPAANKLRVVTAWHASEVCAHIGST